VIISFRARTASGDSVCNPIALPEGFKPGDVISYTAMCSAIGVNLQRGVNFRLRCSTAGISGAFCSSSSTIL
jgi:hypothetical protein